ncbi:unnamed protein product [Pieris macdunnoughi]|uniref:Uncharacterized protein n=1 Tax=Pieris macdunnoughi TaxID=345717 RepID=A0A821LCE9_9NEOP|nr:unnamed protein product [Pieris macdunnoughi]
MKAHGGGTGQEALEMSSFGGHGTFWVANKAGLDEVWVNIDHPAASVLTATQILKWACLQPLPPSASPILGITTPAQSRNNYPPAAGV